jgi:hypothetical protein
MLKYSFKPTPITMNATLLNALNAIQNHASAETWKRIHNILDSQLDLGLAGSHASSTAAHDLAQAISGVDIETAQWVDATISGSVSRIYPLPEYDWDGGSPIFTETFNLKTLATNSIGGGPTANLATRHDSNYPGITVHRGRPYRHHPLQLNLNLALRRPDPLRADT